MKKVLLLLAACLLASLCIGCGRFDLYDDFSPPNGTILLSSSFDNGASVEWSPEPDERYWVVEDGRYGLADHAPNGVPQRVFSRQSDWNGFVWDNYSLTVRVFFSSSDWVQCPVDDYTSILFRVLDDENYMELRFVPTGGYDRAPKWQYPGPPGAAVELYSVRSGEDRRLGGCYVGMLGQSEYLVDIELHGRLCLVYVDGLLALNTPDVLRGAGGVGLQAAVSHEPSQLLEPAQWREVWFDDVVVTAY